MSPERLQELEGRIRQMSKLVGSRVTSPARDLALATELHEIHEEIQRSRPPSPVKGRTPGPKALKIVPERVIPWEDVRLSQDSSSQPKRKGRKPKPVVEPAKTHREISSFFQLAKGVPQSPVQDYQREKAIKDAIRLKRHQEEDEIREQRHREEDEIIERRRKEEDAIRAKRRQEEEEAEYCMMNSQPLVSNEPPYLASLEEAEREAVGYLDDLSESDLSILR
jgi:hypothetical protein